MSVHDEHLGDDDDDDDYYYYYCYYYILLLYIIVIIIFMILGLQVPRVYVFWRYIITLIEPS